jgi:hypothetical protein
MIKASGPSDPFAAGKASQPSSGIVSLKVLNAAGSGVWAANLRGKTILIQSSDSLSNGSVYTGFLSRKGAVFVFTLRPTLGNPGSKAPLGPSFIPSPGSAAFYRQALLNAFAAAGTSFPPSDRLGRLARLINGSPPRETRKKAALIVRCEEKGMDIEKKSLAGLFSALEGGLDDSGGGQEKDKRRRPSPGDKFPVKTAEDGDTNNPALLLFNHLSGQEEDWKIVPYKCSAGDLAYCGSLRICYNRRTMEWSKAVLSVRKESGGGDRFFSWHARDRGIPIRVYSDVPNSEDIPAEITQKLRKLGLRIDDIIHSEQIFNGFDEAKDFMNFIDETV